jgi:hypothetical protein
MSVTRPEPRAVANGCNVARCDVAVLAAALFGPLAANGIAAANLTRPLLDLFFAMEQREWGMRGEGPEWWFEVNELFDSAEVRRHTVTCSMGMPGD